MRKIYTFLCSSFIVSYLPAQTVLKVESGTDLFIRTGTLFHAGGLVLNPDADYSLTNNELTLQSSVGHYTINNYASRVLNWQQLTPAFSGTVRFYYSDDVLNGIAENSLALNAYNGTYWQHLTTAARNSTENYVETNPISAVSFSEFALSDELHTLPLQWGPVLAQRVENGVAVHWTTRQELQVSHFVVERSSDNRVWLPVSESIAARNLPNEQEYQFTDLNAPAQRIYYRIRQHDVNGTFRYSPVATVGMGTGNNLLAVYPNPSVDGFRLLTSDPGQVVRVDLIDAVGARIKSWSKAESWYSLSSVAAGRYHIRVELQNGETKHLSLIKQ